MDLCIFLIKSVPYNFARPKFGTLNYISEGHPAFEAWGLDKYQFIVFLVTL